MGVPELAIMPGVPKCRSGVANKGGNPRMEFLIPEPEQARLRERVAIIGAGATGTYCLHALVATGAAAEIVVFEASDTPGPGLAYSPALNETHALANIAGFEIPPLIETLNAWAIRQTTERLAEWGLADSAGDDRAFFPRAVLGEWLAEQFRLICAAAEVPVHVHSQVEVTDIVTLPDTCRVQWRDRDGAARQDEFDRVVVASGYGAISGEDAEAAESTGKSAATAAENGKAAQFGVLGSSLSGIDAAVSIAVARGSFIEDAAGLRYLVERPFRCVLMSRNGLLPEADFWFPHPLPELGGFTGEFAAECVQGEDGDLDHLFARFAQVLQERAPDWAAEIGLSHATADDFAERYFARRRSADVWAHASQNLENVKAWSQNHQTPAWRIIILKAHEIFATVIAALSPGDLARLHRGLKRVFTDNYAAVPHLSIERLLALHEAGVLDVVALGNEYEITPGRATWLVKSQEWSQRFDELVDARGPQAAALTRFPFPTLRLQLCASALEDDLDWNDGVNPASDLTVSEQDSSLKRVHLCALPYLLRNRPFVQGLVECAGMARAVADAIVQSHFAPAEASTSAEDLIELLDRPAVILATGEVLPLAG